jgi:DNA invertase Pin-like site-specific DNA recombinase
MTNTSLKRRDSGLSGATTTTAREYLRVSFDRSGEEKSNAEQHRENLAAASAFGIDRFGKPYDDVGSASRHARRPRDDFSVLLDDLRDGRFEADVLVLWESSRGSRKVGEWVDLIELCESAQVKIAVTTHGRCYDPSNPRDRRSLLEDAVDSEYESSKTSARTRRAVADRRNQGKPNGGRRAMGYRRVGQKADPAADGNDTRALVLDPVEAPVVKELIERVAAGQTLTRIADDLNARGAVTSTGETLTITTVRRVALNGLYAGFVLHKGEEVEGVRGEWPAIVDEATWRRAVAMLNAPDRQRQRAPRRYLLTGGIVVCGKCDAAMRSKPHHARSGLVRTYACPPTKLGGCGGVSVRADNLEHLVAEVVVRRVGSAAFAKELRSHEGGDRKAAAEVQRLTKEIAEIERAKASGALSLREYLTFRDAANERLVAERVRMAGDTKAAAVGRFAGQSGVLRKWWDAPDTTLDERLSVVRAAIKQVVVRPVGKGTGKVFDERRVKVIPV